MTVLTSIIVAAAATLLIDVGLVVAFYRIRHGIDHEPLHDAYLKCDGDWHEAYINKCGDGLNRFPQQPINTYSNLAFVAGGVFVGQYFGGATAQMFMAAMVMLAIGSALYHGLSVRWAGHMDVLAIYWVLLALLFNIVGRLGTIDPAFTSIAMFVGGGVIAAYLRLVRKHVDMALKIGLILTPIYGLTAWHAVRVGEAIGYILLGVSLGLFLIAFVVWNLDKRQVKWLGGSGHGVWHLLSAGGFSLLFWVAIRV